MGEYFGFLRDVYFFNDLSDDEVQSIESLCKRDRFERGQIIFRENAPAERFFIVLDGMVEVWKDYASPSPDLLAVHGRGHLFGEMALIDDLPRSATVVAKTDTQVLYLFREEFDRVLRENTGVALSILRSLSAMVRKSNESFVEDLRRRNQELEAAYADLQAAQEELLRAERLSTLGKLSSMILHDIRNPISILRGFGEMIQVVADDPVKVREYAASTVREADRLNGLANELLDYTRGEIRLEVGVVPVQALFDRVEASLGERLAASGIRVEVSNEVSDPVLLDQERMARVLINLCDNARKAMGSGDSLRLRARRVAGDLEIEVADTGAGMEPDVVRHIFEPFYSSSPNGGTGLGMVIVKSVVEAHRGSITVESEPGSGTTVRVLLPGAP
ncbi:MAG: sensor histidine kinase [Spirochaetota bacterium]